MYVIIGASGFLGSYLIKNILEITSDKVVATYSSHLSEDFSNRVQWVQCDVTDIEKLKQIEKDLPDNYKLIYLAAFHHPDEVQKNKSLAWNINIIALANAVNIFSRALCFYYSSTDTVYGEGSKYTAFIEEDKLNPVNLYGVHKVLAEQIVLASGGNVIRYPFILGKSLLPYKKHFFDFIIDQLSSGKSIEMFVDSFRSTLDFNQCAKLLVKLIEKYGACSSKILNISGDDILSKYDVAMMIAEKYNFDKTLIIPISIDDNKNIFMVKRAASAILDNTKIKQLLLLDKIKLEL